MNWFDSAKMLLEKWKARESGLNLFGGHFAPRAMQTILLAREEAQRLNHNFIGTEHLLLGLIKFNRCVAAKILQDSGVNLDSTRIQVEKFVGRGPEPMLATNIPYTPRLKTVFTFAVQVAKKLNHDYVVPEHLLLGILAERQGIATRVLQKDFKLDLDALRKDILNKLPPTSPPAGEGQNGK